MSRAAISERLAVQIKIALSANNTPELDELARLAGEIGLTRAEVNLARRGLSYDVRDGGAIALALAFAANMDDEIERAKRNAAAVGVDEDGMLAIKQLVRLRTTG